METRLDDPTSEPHRLPPYLSYKYICALSCLLLPLPFLLTLCSTATSGTPVCTILGLFRLLPSFCVFHPPPLCIGVSAQYLAEVLLRICICCPALPILCSHCFSVPLSVSMYTRPFREFRSQVLIGFVNLLVWDSCLMPAGVHVWRWCVKPPIYAF